MRANCAHYYYFWETTTTRTTVDGRDIRMITIWSWIRVFWFLVFWFSNLCWYSIMHHDSIVVEGYVYVTTNEIHLAFSIYIYITIYIDIFDSTMRFIIGLFDLIWLFICFSFIKFMFTMHPSILKCKTFSLTFYIGLISFFNLLLVYLLSLID